MRIVSLGHVFLLTLKRREFFFLALYTRACDKTKKVASLEARASHTCAKSQGNKNEARKIRVRVCAHAVCLCVCNQNVSLLVHVRRGRLLKVSR